MRGAKASTSPPRRSPHFFFFKSTIHVVFVAQAFLLEEMLEVGFELVSSTMPNVMVLRTY